MAASDPMVSKRTWQSPMDAMTRTKTGSTRIRHERAMMDEAFDTIRNLPIVETNSTHFLDALAAGTVATNVFLRRIHNFALDMGWLPWPVLPKKQWPKIRFKEKRAVSAEEHKAIVAAEKNPERRAFYELCWHLGGAQSDVANLVAEDIDWQTKTVSFYRKKTGTASIIRFGAELEAILQGLPKSGPLFPNPNVPKNSPPNPSPTSAHRLNRNSEWRFLHRHCSVGSRAGNGTIMFFDDQSTFFDPYRLGIPDAE